VSLNYSDVVLRDFSAGISDNYINMPLNRYEFGDNLFIKEDRSFESRYGSVPVYDREVDVKINYINNLSEDIIAVRDSLVWLFDEVGGVLTQPNRPQAGSPIWNNTTGFTSISADTWQDQLILVHSDEGDDLNRPMRVYRDELDALQLSQMGLTGISDFLMSGVGFARDNGNLVTYNPVSPVPPPNASAFAATYIYGFHYIYEYQTQRSTYRVVSDVRFTNIVYTNTEIDAGTGQRMVISGIPALSGVSTQYDISRVRVEIFRSVNGGTSFFKVGEVANGTATFTDNIKDEILVTAEPIYTSGGVLDRFASPKAKYVKFINDTPYWGYVADETSGDVKPFRVIQGYSGIADSHDPASFVDLDDEVRGIGEVNGFPIAFTASEIYRLEGAFNNTGGGGIRTRTISETAGCASHNSIVTANNALYWIGDSAVYFTNGYKVEKVPASIDLLKTIRELTKDLARARTINGRYDENNERIIWGVNKDNLDNDEWLVLNLNTLGFTTASDVPSSALHILNDSLYRADELGYIYKHENGTTSDPVRDVTRPIGQWFDKHIEWLYKSVGIDFGDPALTNWVSHFSPQIQSETNYGVAVGVDCDDGRVQKDCKFVRSWGNFFWGDPSFVWGDPEIVWSKAKTIRYKRHTPRGTSRAKTRQLTMKPAEVVIYKSDTYGLSNISYVVPTDPTEVNVSLASGDAWPDDIYGYKISFESDEYANKYNILKVIGNNIVLSGGIITGNGLKWQISGKYKKSQVKVNALTIRVAAIDNEGNEFTSGGGNE